MRRPYSRPVNGRTPRAGAADGEEPAVKVTESNEPLITHVPRAAPVPPGARTPSPISGPTQPGLPTGQLALCPYCGHRQSGRLQCERCRGLFEPLSRQATQNMMGPWFVHDEQNPHRPGCSFDKLKDLAARGRIQRETIIRGPSTRQFWTLACNTPGVAVLLSECHACHARVTPDEYMCKSCGAALTWVGDRHYLGLAPVKLLPGEATPGEVASSGMAGSVLRGSSPAPTAPRDAAGVAAPTEAEGEGEAEPAPALRKRRSGAWRILGFTMIAAALLGGAVVTAIIFGPAPDTAQSSETPTVETSDGHEQP